METTTSSHASADWQLQRERNALVSRLETSDLFRNYQRAFQSLSGLPLVLRAAGSFQTPLHGSKRSNAFCALMAAKNKTCAACLSLQERLETGAGTTARTAECFAGLNESLVPVRVGEVVVAYLQTGQVLFHAPSPAQCRKAAQNADRLGGGVESRAELAEAYGRTNVVKRSHYEALLRMLEIFAQHLAALGNQLMVTEAQAESPVVARARAYINEHLTQEVSLSDVARAVGMSSCYFCKFFHRSTGLTFTEYLSRLRIEAVKRLLLNPHTRVSEAAYEAGFQSLSQFNRVFLRTMGEPPTAYRDRLHSGASSIATNHPLPLVAA
jgi:AraC-like DNA-binding protein